MFTYFVVVALFHQNKQIDHEKSRDDKDCVEQLPASEDHSKLAHLELQKLQRLS
jgi:hypothetical protein